jgi:ferric-dicitrate binding protein FerR (iron transport regulator)
LGRRCGFLEKNLKITYKRQDRSDLKKDSKITVNDLLISRYLSGEATPEDAMTLDQWRRQSIDNQRIFEEFEKLWNHATPPVSYIPPETDKHWDNLNTALSPSKPVLWFRRVAAAVVIILACTSLVYFYGKRSDRRPSFSSLPHISGGIATNTLPDGSSVTVCGETTLAISDQFGKKMRELQLNSGEAYFTVKENTGDPFVVWVDKVKITVLGTAFNVINDPATVTVAVAEGRVKMESDSQTLLVTGGATGGYFKATNVLRLFRDSLNENAYGYATRTLKLDNMNLAEVKEVLEKTYSIRVHLQDTSLYTRKINTRFYNQALEYVVKVISTSLNIQYRIEGDDIFFFVKKMS